MKTRVRIFAAAVVIIVAMWQPGVSSTVEVRAWGLNHFYGPDTTRYVGGFFVTFDPATIVRAWILVNGDLVWPSYFTCSGGGGGFNGNNFFATMKDTAGVWETETFYTAQRVSFETGSVWLTLEGATWEFLEDGTGAIELVSFARPLPAGCTYEHGSSGGTAEVTAVKLLIELDDATPVEETTWGRIKSLYRAN